MYYDNIVFCVFCAKYRKADFMKKIESSSEEIDEKRYRHFMILLYPDTSSYNYNDVLADLVGSFKNYAYINHDPESDEKKNHTHFLISFDNARSTRSLSKRIGVPKQFIQSVKSLRASCRYLTHIDYDSKTQYNLVDVHVSRSFSKTFFSAYDDLKSEEDIIDDIYLYIDSLSEDSFREANKSLIKFVNSQSYDTIYKRYRYEFQDYLKDCINKCYTGTER